MMSAPKWSAYNLQTHYKTRIQEDDDCWRELLSISRTMTRDEYEQASYKAHKNGVLEYDAEEKGKPRRLYRLDKRKVLIVATSPDGQWMVTCFHKHPPHRKHEAGSTVPRIEHVIEYLDDLDGLIGGKSVKLYRINTVTGNLKNETKKKYKIKEILENIRTKCTKD